MQPTKYKNLYRTEGLFQYVYFEDNSKIEARDWNDLKFKLAMPGIKLQEMMEDEKIIWILKSLILKTKQLKSKPKQ